MLKICPPEIALAIDSWVGDATLMISVASSVARAAW